MLAPCYRLPATGYLLPATCYLQLAPCSLLPATCSLWLANLLLSLTTCPRLLQEKPLTKELRTVLEALVTSQKSFGAPDTRSLRFAACSLLVALFPGSQPDPNLLLAEFSDFVPDDSDALPFSQG